MAVEPGTAIEGIAATVVEEDDLLLGRFGEELVLQVLGEQGGSFEGNGLVLLTGPKVEDPDEAAALVRACLRKASFPEPLRIAHLVARAVVLGESRGRA